MNLAYLSTQDGLTKLSRFIICMIAWACLVAPYEIETSKRSYLAIQPLVFSLLRERF